MRPVVNSSTMAAARNQSAPLRCSAASEQRRRSGRGGKNAARGTRAASVRARVPFPPHPNARGQHDGDRLSVEPFPEPALIVIPAQPFLGLFMVRLHPGAAMGIGDHNRHGGGGCKVTPVIFAVARLAATGPLADQPAEVDCAPSPSTRQQRSATNLPRNGPALPCRQVTACQWRAGSGARTGATRWLLPPAVRVSRTRKSARTAAQERAPRAANPFSKWGVSP